MQVSQANPFAVDRLLSLRRGPASPEAADASLTAPEQQAGRQTRGGRDRRDTPPPTPATVLRFEPVGGYAAATTRAFSSSLVALDLSALPAAATAAPGGEAAPATEPAVREPTVADLLARALSGA